MKKLFSLFFCLLGLLVFSQKTVALDSLSLAGVSDFLSDDYGNVYIYKKKDFGFTKYDTVGKQLGKLMFTVPFKVQSVQNPLLIPMFSENGQEMRFVDQNLNDIQRLDFRQKFGFVKLVFAEDLQQLWILEESTKRLIQYNYRNDTTINSYPFDLKFEELIDLLVFESKVYLISRDKFRVFNFKFENLFEAPIENANRLRRENENIFVMSKNKIQQYIPKTELKTIFEDQEAKIVDKNNDSYFEIKDNKVYLYKIKTVKEDE
jgi:hypothetical protein